MTMEELSEYLYEEYMRHLRTCAICWAGKDDPPSGFCPEGRARWQRVWDFDGESQC